MTFIIKTFLSRNLFTENCTLKSFETLFIYSFVSFQSYFLQSHSKSFSSIIKQKQLAQFDAETQQKMTQAEMDTLPSLEVKHAHARLELRERQLQELAGTMSELSTEEV